MTAFPLLDERPAPTAASPSSAHSWVDRAACRGQTELFYAPHAEHPEARERREAEARALCLACPALEPCRAWAREQREYGFWGGESEEERAAAGYPVAVPMGRVARIVQARRSAIPDPASTRAR